MSSTDDAFKGYNFGDLRRQHTALNQRRTRRGVKSIRTPRGYFLLATKFAKKEPLPLHLVTRQSHLGTRAIASNVVGYLDPNIKSYIRNTWWPLAHFNPIAFKKNNDLYITKDDYLRFNCRIYRSLLPDISYTEAKRRIDKDWRDDTAFIDDENIVATIESNPDDAIGHQTDENAESSPTISSNITTTQEPVMDFTSFFISLLDMATACTGGGMDALYLFLQSLQIKMKLVRDFDELPKPKYNSADMGIGLGGRTTVIVDYGKIYEEEVKEHNRTIQTATLYQVGLFPTKLPVIAAFFSLEPRSMDFYIKAIDSSKSKDEQTAQWNISNVQAGALVYKTNEVNITSIKHETMECFVVPSPGTGNNDTSYEMVCVLQDFTPLEFGSAFYGSIASKRVRVFSLKHPETESLLLTLTTEPTVPAVNIPQDKKPSVSGCLYLIKQDEVSTASYLLQYHELLYDVNGESIIQIMCPLKQKGDYFAIIFSLNEMQFLLEYNNMILPLPPQNSGDTGIQSSHHLNAEMDRLDLTLVNGSMPCYFPGTKIPIRIPEEKSSLRSKINSFRLRARLAQMQIQEDEFRQRTKIQLEQSNERIQARRSQQCKTTEPKRDGPLKPKDQPDIDREIDLMKEYFEHMAKTQPNFAVLRQMNEEKEQRLQQVEKLADNYGTVYAEDRELKKLSDKDKAARFGVDDVLPKEGVFAAEEYDHAAWYLEKLSQELLKEREAQSLADAKVEFTTLEEKNLYLHLAEGRPLTKENVANLRESLLQSGKLNASIRPSRNGLSTVPIFLPKTYLSATLPWQPMWNNSNAVQPDPLVPKSPQRHPGPKKPSPSPKKVEQAIDTQCLPHISPPSMPTTIANADPSIVTSILQIRTANLTPCPSVPEMFPTRPSKLVPHRPSTAAPDMSSSRIATLPDIPSKQSPVDEVYELRPPTCANTSEESISTHQPKEQMRKRKKKRKHNLKLPWSRLQPEPPPSSRVPSIPEAIVNQPSEDVVVVKQMQYQVIRHQNKVVAIHGGSRVAINKGRQVRPKSSSTKSRIDKPDSLQLAKVLGNERMALMWEQLEDEFAWAASENPA